MVVVEGGKAEESRDSSYPLFSKILFVQGLARRQKVMDLKKRMDMKVLSSRQLFKADFNRLIKNRMVIRFANGD